MPSGIVLVDELAAGRSLHDQAAPGMPNVPMAAGGTTGTTGL
jgi:hypothetical protein